MIMGILGLVGEAQAGAVIAATRALPGISA
jgi:hypothetical protein